MLSFHQYSDKYDSLDFKAYVNLNNELLSFDPFWSAIYTFENILLYLFYKCKKKKTVDQKFRVFLCSLPLLSHLTLPVHILDYNSIRPYPVDKKLVEVVVVYQKKIGRADTAYSTKMLEVVSPQYEIKSWVYFWQFNPYLSILAGL